MRLAAWLFALVLSFAWFVPRAKAAGQPSPTRIAGRDYVALADWARGNGFALRWLKRDETVQLSRSGEKIVLQVRAPEAAINGIEVRLLFPLAQRNDVTYISTLDVRWTLEPLLSPPRLPAGARLRSICLDPGHGGKDSGYRVGSSQEKKYVLLLAQELRDQLKRAGWKVSLTRTSDKFVELPDRAAIANRRKADLFLSLHFNAVEASPGTVQGAEVYCLTPAGAPSSNSRGEGAGAGACVGNRNNGLNLVLAYQLQKSLTRSLGVDDRGVRRARFAVLRDVTMPAALVEGGYMSHPAEAKKLMSAEYRRRLARAIVDGLAAYKRIVEPGG